MKYLILGIDGGDLKILEAFDMPFLKQLISKSKTSELTEDLLTRGWAKILTGHEGSINNSFYIKPEENGKPKSTLSYKYSDMKANSSNKLIWELAEEKKFSVGIMNIPTTYPAPEVNGFFVSGAGGGLYKVDGIPEAMCDSEDTRTKIEANNYILELRFKPSGIKDPESFFDQLNKMMKIRFRNFIELSNEKGIDFGFLALRASANMQYVVMREIQAYIDGELKNDFWKNLLEEHYSLLDSLIRELFENLSPEEYIITSDHGQSPLKYHTNYNKLLEELGFLKYRKNAKAILKYGIHKIRNLIGTMAFNNKYYLPVLGKVDYSRTKVFGFWYCNGLYINDKKRFSGPVSENDIDKLVGDTCKAINENNTCKEHGISATPYRSLYKSERFSDNAPDIWIDAPSTHFFQNMGNKFIQKNPWYRPLSKNDFSKAPTSMFTGIKGKTPLFIMSPKLFEYISEKDNRDLSLIYKITMRYFNSI